MDKSGKNYSGRLQTSTHSSNFEYSSSSGIVSSMALLALPAAGTFAICSTVKNCYRKPFAPCAYYLRTTLILR